jgi:hypothetical protein
MSDFDWTYDIEYPEFKKGDIVTVPESSTGRSYAIIDSHMYSLGDDGYQVTGPSMGDPWRRWVPIKDIKQTDKTCLCEIGYVPFKHSSKCSYMNETFGNG